jgi:hypothetical protein
MQETKENPSGLIQQPKDNTTISQLNLKQLPQPIDSISAITGAARGPRGVYSNRGFEQGRGLTNVAESMIGSMSNYRRIIGNHNVCPKHKNNYINYCLSHAEPLCAECFEDHRGPHHDIQML